MVGVKRLELPAPWSQTTCATKLRYTPTCILKSINSLFKIRYFVKIVNKKIALFGKNFIYFLIVFPGGAAGISDTPFLHALR